MSDKISLEIKFDDGGSIEMSYSDQETAEKQFEVLSAITSKKNDKSSEHHSTEERKKEESGNVIAIIKHFKSSRINAYERLEQASSAYHANLKKTKD